MTFGRPAHWKTLTYLSLLFFIFVHSSTIGRQDEPITLSSDEEETASTANEGEIVLDEEPDVQVIRN